MGAVTAACWASSGSSASDPDAAVLRALGVQLTRESPHLARIHRQVIAQSWAAAAELLPG